MIGPRSEGNAGRPLRARSMRLCRERTKPASLVARQCCMSALCLLACAVPRDACSMPARLCYTARRPRMQLARPVGAETCSAGRSTSTRACGGSATAIRRPVLAGGPTDRPGSPCGWLSGARPGPAMRRGAGNMKATAHSCRSAISQPGRTLHGPLRRRRTAVSRCGQQPARRVPER